MIRFVGNTGPERGPEDSGASSPQERQRNLVASLFRQHHDRVFIQLQRLLGNDVDAEDAEQQVWLTVLRKLQTFEGRSQITTWLHRVARNEGIRVLRKRSRLPRTGLKQLPEASSLERPDSTPDACLAVEVELSKLEPLDQNLLRAHYFDGMEYKDIARTFDPPKAVGTIKREMWEARRALRGRLESGRESA